MKIFKIVLSLTLGFWVLSACEKHKDSGLPTDGDGNIYDTVVIGTQVWLAENLKATKYVGGAPISLVTDNKKWEECKVAAYCWYENNEVYKNIYGGLYNYYAIKIGVLCPVGYHIPIYEEWMELINYLGGDAIAGDKLKEVGFMHWKPYHYGGVGATNESGFTALPGGIRYWYGGFGAIHSDGFWWTLEGKMIGISCSRSEVFFPGYGSAAISVRCIKDK